MGVPTADHRSLIEQARAAHRERRYAAAYDALRTAHEQTPLEPDELRLLSDSAWWLGLMAECLRLTESAHHAYLESGQADRAAMQALDLGSFLAMRGEWALASGWLGRARRLLEGLPAGPTHGLLWFTDLQAALGERRFDDVRSLAAEMRALGEQQGATHLVALGHVGAGLAALREGRVDVAFVELEEASLRVVGGEVDPEWAGYVYCTIVDCCLEVADLNRARLWSAAAYRWLEQFDSAVMFTGVCRAHEVNLLVSEGDWDGARSRAELVVRDLTELNVDAVAEAVYFVAEADRLRGDLPAAEDGYTRCAELGREPQPGHALLLRDRSEHAAAWTEITDALARTDPDSCGCARLLRAAVGIALAAGRQDSAATHAARLRELADRYRTPGLLTWADHAEGLVALVGGRTEDAHVALTRAVAGSRTMKAWYDAAAAGLALGRACRDLGDDVHARQHEEEAEAVFRRLGTPVAEPVVPGPQLDGGLTVREAEVLRVVAAGRSNREVAEELSISEATVRRHLANLYLKLGVSSRTQAAAWAHEHRVFPSRPG